MDSFFFNITDTAYRITELFRDGQKHITRVDISNGLVFFDISISLSLDSKKIVDIKNLDRMIFIVSAITGIISLQDKNNHKNYVVKEKQTALFGSSRQNLTITIEPSENINIFILFISDFFIKRYLSSKKNDPINFVSDKLQKDISMELISLRPTDALSVYLCKQIVNSKKREQLNSIICEHLAIEYLIRHLSLIDVLDVESFSFEELGVAQKVKEIVLKNFRNPPTIKQLTYLCATNEFKLKSYFKKVYKTTVYAYIQKLRLEEANILLRDGILSINEIAKEVGYKNQGYFSGLFYKTYGVYPKDLIKSIS